MDEGTKNEFFNFIFIDIHHSCTYKKITHLQVNNLFTMILETIMLRKLVKNYKAQALRRRFYRL